MPPEVTTEDTADTTGDATGQAEKPANGEEKRFSQAELDQIVKDRLERERKKAEKAAADARAEAERKALEANGEWQKLAEQRGDELSSIRAQLDQATAADKALERAHTAIASQVKALTKDLPKAVVTLLAKLDPVEQLEWLAANRAEVVPSVQSYDINAGARGGNASNAPTEEQRRLIAERYRTTF